VHGVGGTLPGAVAQTLYLKARMYADISIVNTAAEKK